MELTEDSFRALARSSPWRWQGLHFSRHGDESLEAWVQRPGELRVVDARGMSTVERETLGGSSSVLSVFAEAGEVPPPKPRVLRRWPHQVAPALRGDGLVAERPEEFAQEGDDVVIVEYGDPMYVNYQWTAMLDPVELSGDTVVTELVETGHRGRSVWQATMTAIDGYAPTCGCCPLLWSEVSDRDEYGEDFGKTYLPDRPYPTSYRVGLDMETGVVVLLLAAGAEGAEIDLEIHEVKHWW